MRKKHIAEIKRLEEAVNKTKSEKLKADYGKAIKRMRHDLKVYDALRRGDEVGKRTKSKTRTV